MRRWWRSSLPSDSLFTTRQVAALKGPPVGQLAVARHGRQVARPRLPVEATDGQHLSRGDDPVAGLDDPDPEIEVLRPDQLRAEAADLVHDTPRRDHADERVGLQEPRQRDLLGEAGRRPCACPDGAAPPAGAPHCTRRSPRPRRSSRAAPRAARGRSAASSRRRRGTRAALRSSVRSRGSEPPPGPSWPRSGRERTRPCGRSSSRRRRRSPSRRTSGSPPSAAPVRCAPRRCRPG